MWYHFGNGTQTQQKERDMKRDGKTAGRKVLAPAPVLFLGFDDDARRCLGRG